MRTGDVKWFNNAKGYGFIQTVEHDEDIFVHYSEINDDGFKTLTAGENVAFELCEGPDGLYAENVYREKDREEADLDENEEESSGRRYKVSVEDAPERPTRDTPSEVPSRPSGG